MFTLLPCLSVHWAFKNSKSLNKEINVHPKERSLDLLWVSEVLYCTHKVWRENHTRLHIRVGREIIRSKNGFLSGPPRGSPKIWKSNFILNRATVRLKKGLLDLRNSDFVSLADSINVSQILSKQAKCTCARKRVPSLSFTKSPQSVFGSNSSLIENNLYFTPISLFW